MARVPFLLSRDRWHLRVPGEPLRLNPVYRVSREKTGSIPSEQLGYNETAEGLATLRLCQRSLLSREGVWHEADPGF